MVPCPLPPPCGTPCFGPFLHCFRFFHRFFAAIFRIMHHVLAAGAPRCRLSRLRVGPAALWLSLRRTAPPARCLGVFGVFPAFPSRFFACLPFFVPHCTQPRRILHHMGRQRCCEAAERPLCRLVRISCCVVLCCVCFACVFWCVCVPSVPFKVCVLTSNSHTCVVCAVVCCVQRSDAMQSVKKG